MWTNVQQIRLVRTAEHALIHKEATRVNVQVHGLGKTATKV